MDHRAFDIISRNEEISIFHAKKRNDVHSNFEIFREIKLSSSSFSRHTRNYSLPKLEKLRNVRIEETRNNCAQQKQGNNNNNNNKNKDDGEQTRRSSRPDKRINRRRGEG